MELLEIDESAAFDFFAEQDWTDGLPIIPPTPDRVAAMLAGADAPEDEILGSVPERKRTVTAGMAAVNAVMAGCRPEYFPVVLTALRAMLDPAWNANGVLTSTGGSATCIIVSGPLAGQIGMNAKSNLFGPGNRANATIGRAVRLVARNVIGARTSVQDESCMATPAKYTFCFAEDDPPAPWLPLRQQLGFDAEDTIVCVMASEGPRQLANFTNGTPEGVLRSMLSLMTPPGSVIVGKGGQGVVVLGPEHQFIIREQGWSQREVQEFLARESRVTKEQIESAGVLLEKPGDHHYLPVGEDGKYPTFHRPDDILVVTAGGHGAGWSSYIPSFVPAKHSVIVTRRVREAGEALPDCGPDSCDIDLTAIIARSTNAGRENV